MESYRPDEDNESLDLAYSRGLSLSMSEYNKAQSYDHVYGKSNLHVPYCLSVGETRHLRTVFRYRAHVEVN